MDYVKEEGRYVEVTPGPCRLRGKPKMRFAIVWMRDWMVEVCVFDDRCRRMQGGRTRAKWWSCASMQRDGSTDAIEGRQEPITKGWMENAKGTRKGQDGGSRRTCPHEREERQGVGTHDG